LVAGARGLILNYTDPAELVRAIELSRAATRCCRRASRVA
jgi:hypothetical protein